METSTIPYALAVDDEAIIRIDATQILEEAGFRCLDAQSGDEALGILSAKWEQIDVLFTDVEMPGSVDGFALARHVADHWPHIQIIVSSGRARPSENDLPEKAAFISKPFSAEIVLNELRRILPNSKRPELLVTALLDGNADEVKSSNGHFAMGHAPARLHAVAGHPQTAGSNNASMQMSAVDADLIGDDEPQRMAAVRRYDILDTPPDGAFDRITAMAARRFDVPISIVSIVDEDRIWFKSHHGLPISQIGRDAGLCASAILDDAAHVVTDASLDPRALANPLVAGDFGLRFYAGVPLRTSDGYNLGTLCVIDFEARPVDQSQLDDLTDLATIVMDQLELRLSAQRAIQQSTLMAREIDHRVMNSLQFVSTLLKMQSKSVSITDAPNELQIAAQRIGAVAQVHRHFYSGEGASGACLAFLRRLCSDLAAAFDTPVRVSGEEITVPGDWIQPIGLIVNELVTNAAKYGAGNILVDCRTNGALIELTVTDDGPGLPDGFELETSTQGLGMRVVTSLVGQLGGRVHASGTDRGSGTEFHVALPLPRH